MGLDNAIIVDSLPKEDYHLFQITDDDLTSDGEVELCYWRKCWGIRESILSILDPKGIEQKNEEHDYTIDAEDIPAIIRALQPFFSKEYWDENSDSIWEFDEMFLTNLKYLIRLDKLKDYMKEHPKTKVIFIDSY